MSIIAISRGSFSGGVEFAEEISRKLGWPCLGREQLSEEAIKLGVPVGKLQTSMVRPSHVQQRLGPTREFYLACVTSILCKYALQGNLVYHGHTGNLLLPGIPSIFRVRVLASQEQRIKKVCDRFDFSSEKAIEYIKGVDADRDKWVQFLYGINWHDPSHYDLVVNLDQMGVSNATTALCSMAELPDFKLTAVSIRALNDLHLSSRARFLLAKDPRTEAAAFKVTANEGEVQIICPPQHADASKYIEPVLEHLEDCSKIHWTIAGSNILWLGERFNDDSELLNSVLKIARNWNAAVEVMTCCATNEIESESSTEHDTAEASTRNTFDREKTGGIEDDLTQQPEEDTIGLNPVLDTLLSEGCAGGRSSIYGDKETLLHTLGHRTNYSLVVLGDLYVDKSKVISTRLKSDLRSLLTENIDAPVVDAEELKQQLTYRTRDYVNLGISFLLAALLFVLVFLNQDMVIDLLSQSDKTVRAMVIIALLLFTPTFAFAYGSGTRQIFRMLGVR
ncbi:MAG TPA: cytidylate kinase-like family protein [Bacteroidetes bacterium]|nr:cytidylate kinase-like family protein [Bacteroidota bacterium]HEX04863.1 cytidylate kinase-like family protein [Bacteroidota bacterium]